MEKDEAAKLIKKIFYRDYDRWIRYADECIKDKSSYTKSFYVWKECHNMYDEDAELLAEIFCD